MTNPIQAPNLQFEWLIHGFGRRDSVYPDGITTVKQIHSAEIIDACGRKGDRIEEADAIISAEPGVIAGIRTADCVPVLIADRTTRTVAAIHAGWRGSAENIVGATVARLVSDFGSKPADLATAVGPSIGPCCYTVGPDVAKKFSTWTSGSLQLDLPFVTEMQLRAAGVQDIWTAGVCTQCNPREFFSYRREKDEAGRMLSFIGQLAEETA